MSRVIVHIGLHKTASTFLQKEFFRKNTDSSNYAYNPKQIFDLLIPIFEFGFDSHSWIQALRDCYQDWRDENPSQTLFLSSESFSQLLYVQDYEAKLNLLTQIFGDVEIIMFLRNQRDWLASVYRETLKSGDYQSFSSFVGFDDQKKTFEKNRPRFNDGDCLTIEPAKCNWLSLVEWCSHNDRIVNYHVFFFEDLQTNLRSTLEKLISIMDDRSSGLSFEMPKQKVVNKGVSGGGILLLLKLGLAIRFFGFKGGYIRQQSRQKATMENGAQHYIALRQQNVGFLKKISRELFRASNKLTLYSLLVWSDRIVPQKIRNLSYDPHVDSINDLVFKMHNKTNARLFRMLERPPINKYCRDPDNEG
jgi:hypothetical protein